jgi:general nucleoside transport system permease protein
MRIVRQRRMNVPWWLKIGAPAASVVLALLFGAVVMLLVGNDPVKVYALMLRSALTTRFGLSETAVKAIPLMLCGFAVAISMRMQIFNVGAEGQLYLGAAAATWVALTFTGLPAPIMLPAMMLLGCLAGGLWSIIAILPRVLWGISELITTLMLNYVATLAVYWLVNGPWKDPAVRGYPLSPTFVPAALLPTLGTTRVHAGLLIALAIAVGLTALLHRTRWGYEIQVIGASSSAARYAGMNIARNILLVSLLSGALAGLAGMTEVSGVIHRLQEQVSPGYGFTAIIVAALARFNPLAIVVVSFLFSGLIVGGYAIQTANVSANIVLVLQGAILLFVLTSDFFLQYRVRFVRTEQASTSQPARDAPHGLGTIAQEGGPQQ